MQREKQQRETERDRNRRSGTERDRKETERDRTKKRETERDKGRER